MASRPWPAVFLLALLLTAFLPAAVRADCGCGALCECGIDCQCNPIEPPPWNPNAAVIRKNQATLTAKEKAEFVAAARELQQTYRPGKKVSIYDEYVHLHVMAMHEADIHNGPAFFPWHRQFLRNFELELQAINPNVTLPYWDFTVDNKPTSSLWAKDFLGGNGDADDNYIVKTGPFRQGEWSPAFDGPSLYRNFGGFVIGTLPTPEDLALGMLVPRYDVKPFDQNSDVSLSFRNYMTGWNHPTAESEMHNRVHEWVNGSMMTMASPNDPVFWLVHAFLDKTWGEWMSIYGPDYPKCGAAPGHNLRDPLFLFGNTPESVLDHHALGYWYDTEGNGPSPKRRRR